jgi:hypothetical protein
VKKSPINKSAHFQPCKTSVSLSVSVKKVQTRKVRTLNHVKKSLSMGLSLCAPGTCEEKAKVNDAYSNSLWPNECGDFFFLHTQTRTQSGLCAHR